MKSITGSIKVGEANVTVGALMSKMHGSQFVIWAIMLGLIAAGLIAGHFLAPLFVVDEPPDYGRARLFGGIAAALAFFFIRHRLIVDRFRKRFADLGRPIDVPMRMDLADDHFSYAMGGVTHIVKWTAMDEVFRSHGYWIFLAEGNPLYVPQRFFASPADETAFLREVLDRISPAARERSRDARRALGEPSN
jgi:hypothetical protein